MLNKKISVIILSIFITIASGQAVFAYSITVTARPGGKIIAPDGSAVVGPSSEIFMFDENSSAEFSFEPDASKYISDVVVDLSSMGPPKESSYKFTSINSNHEITVVFKDGDAPADFPVSAGDEQILTSEVPLSQPFKDIISRGISFTAPVVAVDGTDGAQSGDAVYMTFFRPTDNGQWEGNLKKYTLAYLQRTDCTGRVEPEWTLVDKNGDITVDCDGAFLESSTSYWSNSSDGGLVDRGGAGQILLESLIEINSSIEVRHYHSFRNIKTYLGDATGSIVSFNRQTVTKDILGIEDDSEFNRIVNYIYGYTYDSDLDGRPVEKRGWVLGDIVHSEPKIIDYIDPDNGNRKYRYIAVGANDGMIHVFTDSDVVFGGKTYSPGDEIFAFIPTDLLPKLNEMATSSKHEYMVDGSPSLFHSETKDSSGYFHKTLVFGERRGGRSYWALDVTNPDPSTWSVRWHIIGGSASGNDKTVLTQEIPELGYSWSKPYIIKIRTGNATIEDAVVFGGGYDLIEDGFPEAFLDTVNHNGTWDTGEQYAVTVGGTEGYDKYNPGADNYGRGIFVRKISDGTALFSVAYNPSTHRTTGNRQESKVMKYCFPADISVIPFSENNLLMYAADIYGQIWKIKYDFYADKTSDFESDLSTRWMVKRIFASNPGSSLAPGSGDGLVTPFIDSNPATPGFNTADQGRKAFYSPEVSYFGNEWTSDPVLYFGTGDRAHPHYRMISDRFYTVVDSDAMTYETDLMNLTCNELDVDADPYCGNKENNSAGIKGLQNDIKSLFYNGNVDGFYRIMDKQGDCSDTAIDHSGEKILSQPTLFAGVVYFTSYQPVFDEPTGNVFVYALEYSFGTSAFNYYLDDRNSYGPRNLEDTYFKISNSSIPSGVQIITKGGEAAGLIGTGGKVSGVGEDQSMNIPGPPGGISRLLWEVE